MTETKESLAILKARWPEVVFIIALNVIALSVNMTQIIFHPMKTPLRIAITVVFLLFYIITYLLIFGFQRTVYTEKQKRQTPFVLLRQGKHFFLSLAGLSIIYSLVLACLQVLIFWAIKNVTSLNSVITETRWGMPLAVESYTTLLNLILMKLLLLIFPLIIVLDCGIFESFKLLGKCRLRNARELVILYLITLALSFVWTFLPFVHVQPSEKILYYIINVSQIIIWRLIDLLMAVMAIRFVAAQDLRYDNKIKPSDSQDLLNPSI